MGEDARASIEHSAAAKGVRARNLKAIAATLAASFLYMLSDAAMKLASAVPAGERVFLRTIGVVALLGTVVAWKGLAGQIRRALVPLMGWRSLGDASNSIFFQIALGRMPFADAMGILQLTPLTLTAAAALFLGAGVGWRRWTAVLAGLLGALCVIKPGTSAFNVSGIFVVLCVIASVGRDVATRRFDAAIAPLVILLVSQLGVGAITALLCGVEVWVEPTALQLGQLAVAAAFFAGGHLAALYAIRDSDWAVVAPFRYSGIVWGILLGFLIWRELPDSLSCLGIGLMVGAGLYTLHREARQRAG